MARRLVLAYLLAYVATQVGAARISVATLDPVDEHRKGTNPDEHHKGGLAASLLQQTGSEKGSVAKRLCAVLVPVLILLAFVAGMLSFASRRALVVQREKSERAPDVQDHPLMVQFGHETAVKQLHVESSFFDHVKKTFTVRRVVTLVIALCLIFAGALLIDETDFAIVQGKVGISTMEDCKKMCDVTPKSLCDADKGELTFKVKTDKKGVHTNLCEFKVVPLGWKIDIVLLTLMFGIHLIIEGVEAELVLVGISCIYAATGIITASQAFSGFTNGGVIALCLLFPVAAAIEETGVLDSAVSVLLGNPSMFMVALFRMMFPVAFLSAFLSNTAIVTMMIPIVVSWSRRLNVSPGKMLMPLSYSAQLGGTTTLVGSSICLVAKESVDPDAYDMGFFDLAPVGTCVALATFVFIALCLGLLRSSAPSDDADAGQAELGDASKSSYHVGLLVVGYWYKDTNSAELCEQLSRMPGVNSITCSDERLEVGSVLKCECTAAGVTPLRMVKGMELQCQNELRLLGTRRRKRKLFEVVVKQDSALVGSKVEPAVVRSVLGSCVISVRGKPDASAPIDAGDVLIVEADKSFLKKPQWDQQFSVTKDVANSKVPRQNGVHDNARAVVTCCGMAILIALVTFEVVKLQVGAGIFLLVLVLTRAISVPEAYETMKPGVLFTIAGAFGLSEALQATGVANFASASICAIAKPGGTVAVRFALYFISAFLSMFMNNSATVAILGPMLNDIAIDTRQTVQSCLFVVVFGAGTCLTTPLGYQTNMMVMKDGGYTFGDFMVYGAPIQFLHMVSTLFFVWLFCPALEM